MKSCLPFRLMVNRGGGGGGKGPVCNEKLACEDDLYTVTLASLLSGSRFKKVSLNWFWI
jgi:hypothetical protein